jgi:rhodanese-related sulfurtransferase
MWINKILTSQFSTIVVVADANRINEVDTRIRRTGYNQALLYLRDGIKSWKNDRKTIDTIHSINVDSISKYKDAEVLDVRKPREYYSQHLVNAINNPLDYISSDKNLIALDKAKKYLVYCTSGYSSLIFISMMKARGLHNLTNIKGGFRALKYSNHFELSKYACPTTMSTNLF